MENSNAYIGHTHAARRSRAELETIQGWGADLDRKDRPGVPMERTPPRFLEGKHWDQPEQQKQDIEVLVSPERPGLTPIFGTSAPPKGLSGMLRRVAFKLTENDIRHWLLLLLADRLNMVEGIGQDLGRGHIPNVLGEMGIKSEWQHTQQGGTGAQSRHCLGACWPGLLPAAAARRTAG